MDAEIWSTQSKYLQPFPKMQSKLLCSPKTNVNTLEVSRTMPAKYDSGMLDELTRSVSRENNTHA